MVGKRKFFIALGIVFVGVFSFSSTQAQTLAAKRFLNKTEIFFNAASYNVSESFYKFSKIHKSNVQNLKKTVENFKENITNVISQEIKVNSLAQISTNLPEEPPSTSSSNSLPSSSSSPSSPDLTPETNKISDLQALLQEVQALIAGGAGVSQLQVVTPAAASSQLADLESSLLDLQNKQSKDYLALIRMIGQTGNIGQ
ncbi:MAG TPA: hypothetical protein VJH70_00900, partial [Candidatus Paceibacterota bacterium]